MSNLTFISQGTWDAAEEMLDLNKWVELFDLLGFERLEDPDMENIVWQLDREVPIFGERVTIHLFEFPDEHGEVLIWKNIHTHEKVEVRQHILFESIKNAKAFIVFQLLLTKELPLTSKCGPLNP